MLVTGPDGGIVNDPVLLHVPRTRGGCSSPTPTPASTPSAWARRPASTPRSPSRTCTRCRCRDRCRRKTLEKLVGQSIYDIKYYWTERFEIKGIPVVISRTGWTAMPGFEVNLLDGTPRRRPVERGRRGRRGVRHPADRAVRGAPDRSRHLQLGLRHPARRHPVARHGPRAARRGPAAGLHRQGRARGAQDHGVDRRLVGIELEGDELRAEMSEYWHVSSGGKKVGHMTDAVWSPRLKKNIGYVWVPTELSEPGTTLDVESENGYHSSAAPRRSRSSIPRRRCRRRP